MSFTTRPELRGTFGAVTSTHWLASAAGMAMLEKGGNAFDAAVATGFVLQVVEPHLNGPLGDVPIIFCAAGTGEAKVLCGQGVAPAAATIDHFRGLGLDHVPGTGLLPAVVPGAFDAWCALLRDHGTMSLGQVLAPAISYAANGYPLLQAVVKVIRRVSPLFEKAWPSSLAIYRPGGNLPRAKALFRNPVLAATYGRIVAAGEAAGRDRVRQIEAARAYFYEGAVAESIERFCADNKFLDDSGSAHGGLLTREDLANWSATYEAPATYDYEGYTLCKTGPWGQGPVLLQQLALLKGFDLAAMDPNGAEFVHTVVECAKLAFADREAYYADPDFVLVPLRRLLADEYNEERRRLLTDQASLEARPGVIAGFEQQVAASKRHNGESSDEGSIEPVIGHLGEQVKAKTEAGRVKISREPGDTCHLDVIDRHGNVVSATPSGGWLQSSPVIPELGFCLGTRGQMFWLDEDSPSCLAPGKRPRTTLTPSLAMRGGEPVLAFGTPGGDQQDQWSLIFFLRHVHHGLNLQESIDAPQFFSNH
ncbi:MAG: gamma-glutamyltransferase family protein, partial [Alphaproteobacteria bacterium]